MPSKPSAATLEAAWDILKHYPELYWNPEALAPYSILLNAHAVLVFSQVLDEVELLLIATHPDYLRQGYAEALLKSCLLELSNCNIFLEVRTHNTPARKLYEKLGFIETGRRTKYYRDGEDAILYHLHEMK